MGNVHAFSSAPPPPTPPPSMNAGASSDCVSEEIENPGPLEDIHTKCKSMFKHQKLLFTCVTSFLLMF